jgi:hypothetical protein
LLPYRSICSIVPSGLHLDIRLVDTVGHDFSYPHGHLLADHTDGSDQRPGERTVHQELSLLGFLDQRVPKVVIGDMFPAQLAELGYVPERLKVCAPRIPVGERPGSTLAVRPGQDLVKVRLEVKDGTLSL